MIRKVAVLFLTAVVLLVAQTGTSRIRGVVTDTTGAVAPNANVTALHEPTGLTRGMATNAYGQYNFDGMPLGPYTITVSLAGFKTLATKGNDLSVGEVLTVDVTLEPGAVTESISVSATSTVIQTSESSLGNVLDTKPIEQLPLNGRNPLHLMALQPGVAGHAAQATSRSGTVTFYVNGDRGRGVYTTLDGVDVSDPVIPRGELAHVLINPDSASEYRVITSVAKAEYGRNSGAQVQVVSRSGTNSFHGNLFEFHRNTALNANDWFNNRGGIGREVLLRHQFGGSLGGPIRKNIGFFFFNWQSQRLSQSISEVRTVLTPEARSGLFRYFVSGQNSPTMVDSQGRPLVPACGGSLTSNCYRTYNMVQGDLLNRGLDPLTQKMIKLTNLPNDFSAGDGFNTARFRFNAASRSPVDSLLARVDWRFGSNHQAYARYGNAYNNLYGDFINSGLPRYPANPDSYPGRTRESHSQGAASGLNSVLGASKVNEFSVGFTRNTLFFLDPTHPKLEVVANIQSDPFLYWGGTGRIPENTQVVDNFSFVKQNHTFKAGVNVRYYRINQFRRATNFYPRFTFGTSDAPVFLRTGEGALDLTGINSNDRSNLNSLFNDLMGVVGTVRKVFYSNGTLFPSADNELRFAQRTREYNFYFQDDWRVSPRLTLNLGLRYEYNTVPFDKSGMQVVADKPLGSRSGDVTLLPAGLGTGRAWYDNDRNNFAPAVGFAWNPSGNQKTSIRGGYRIAYNRLVNWALNVVEQNQPGTTKVQILRPNSSATAANPPAVRASDPAAQALIQQLPNGVVGLPVERTPAPDRSSTPLIFDRHLRTPYVNQWNFSIQHEVLPNTVVEIAYVGNKGAHMFRMLNENQATVSPDFLASFVAAQQGVRAGPVGALLGTYGASVPSSVTNDIANNNVGAFITTMDTGAFNGVVGGRLVAAGLGQGYFRNPQFATAALGCSCTNSSYNALQVSVNRRLSSGLILLSNYTWAKSLDDISDDTDGAGQGLLIPTDNRNRRLDWGRSDFDIRHQFRAAVIYDLPFGSGRPLLNRPGVVSALIGGWTTNVIIDWSSGYPFSVSSGRTTLWPGVTTTAIFNGDPTQVGKLVKGGNSVTYFTTEEKSRFSAPAPGQFGAGRNIFTGPGFFQTDLGLHKSIPVRESIRVELRGEAFNVFNTPNFNPPNVTSTSASFGVISTLRVPPRIIQVAAKLYF
ncbi:MAG: TonB-dependent receptor [Acidobacteria bacterium]|nr:TonB-dependent receptor [Acidobacteriota bacterium]